MQRLELGNANIQPQGAVVAGAFTTLTFTYTAGHPIDDSGYIKITFRSVSDFGTPQFDNPTAPNYCTVSTTGDCSIQPRWDVKGHTRPWSRALFLKIGKGFLDSSETVQVIFGDTSGDSPGWQIQSFCEETFEFKTFVDPIATYEFKELPASPTVQIVAGEPVRAVCIAPSQVLVGQAFTYWLKLEDRWGNPTAPPQEITHPGRDAAGVQTVMAKDDATGLSTVSNPIDVLAEVSPLHPYWADFHGQTEETVGSRTIENYFVFARDYGLLDIVGHQGNDFQVTDEFWEKINQVTKTFYQPGSFVTFPGYEWSGNTPLGGDRNVYFASEGGQITRSCTDLLPDKYSKFEDSPTATDLFANLSKQNGPKPFAFAHVGGRFADIRMHDPEIELAVEIHSAWGTFEWLVEDAFKHGYRSGICANSDGHKCRPGASYPGAHRFGSLGGLTCVLAPKLDRESIYEASKARHFYATTGNRPLVEVRLVTGDGRSAMMGDVIEVGSGTPQLHIRVVGTVPVESIEVRNGLDVLETLRPYSKEDLGSRIKVTWSGAEVRGRDRIAQWDGGLEVVDNAILQAVPINFWNANQPLEIIGDDQLAWKSITTGGVTGVIVTLNTANAGRLEIKTLQQNAECDIETIGLEPITWDCGGLGKTLQVSRLPDKQLSCEFSASLPLNDLQSGDNPIYIRMMQEDGHMTWTSPIYLTNP